MKSRKTGGCMLFLLIAFVATFVCSTADADGPCTATLSLDLSLHLPAVAYSGQDYSADLTYVPDTQDFLLAQAGAVTDAGQFSHCFPADLSPALNLHVPEILFGGISYFADFQSTRGLVFTLTEVGDNPLYHLQPGTTFQEGCVYPCLCPLFAPGDMSGTFRLVRLSPDGSFIRYLLSEISWTMRDRSGKVVHIAGQGMYRLQIGPVRNMQQLTLDLSVDAGAPTHFDSGLIPATASFPAISLSLDRGSSCFNTWLVINASKNGAHTLATTESK
jgi:hypothetical protein